MKTEQEQIKAMTKDEIKKALEFCAQDNYYFCGGCSYDDVRNCNDKLKTDALNVIIEQEKEIERLKEKCKKLSNEKCNAQDELDCYYDEMPNKIKRAKIDVLNELKTHSYYDEDYMDSYVFVSDIDELIEEVENETKKETSRSTL